MFLQRPQGKNEVSGFKMEQGGQCGRSGVMERRGAEDGGKVKDRPGRAAGGQEAPAVVLLRSNSHNIKLTIL